MLFFDAASRAPGKETGRTGDKAIVPAVTDKALPTYFRKSIQGNLKDYMVRGGVNPLANVAFIVDAQVQYIGDQPRGYIVTDVHDTVPLGGDDKDD
jgi:hypothetical protein